MNLLGGLEVLTRVVETGSFSAVARERASSQAAVGRQIAQLEQHFGVRLLHRTTRKLSLTDDGQMLLGLSRPILDRVSEMEAALGRQRVSPVGLVRFGVPTVAARFLSPRLPVMLDDHPGLKIELVVSDRFGDMIEDRLDLAIAVGSINDASLIVRKTWVAERAVVAAPSYVERCGAPSTPIELKSHTCIVHNTGPNSDVWTFTAADGRKDVRVGCAFLANEPSVVHLAARTGHGIAFLGMLEVLDDLQSGALVRLLTDFPASGLPINLVYPSRRNLAPRTRVVLEFIQQQIQDAQRMVAHNSEQLRV